MILSSLLRSARAALGRDEVEQLVRIATWKRRPLKWELVDAVRLNRGRHKIRVVRHPLTGDELSGLPSPVELAERGELRERLHIGIAKLAGKHRRVLEALLVGKTHLEIGAELGVTERRIWQIQVEAARYVREDVAMPGLDEAA